MKKIKSKNFVPEKSHRNVKEVFFLEALGHVSASDTVSPLDNEIVLKKGTLITPKIIGTLAELGVDRVYIHDKPNVSVVVVGNGLIAPGTPPSPDKKYDSTNPMLQAALEAMRIRPVFMRRLLDEPKTLKRLIPFALNQSDILILVIKEFQYSREWITELVNKVNSDVFFLADGLVEKDLDNSIQKKRKLTFCMPNDLNFILDSFYKYIQPTIRSFMGVAGFVEMQDFITYVG